MAFHTPTYRPDTVIPPIPEELLFSENETPSGSMDGSNAIFTLAHSPDPADSLILVLNGQVQTQGVEYTLSGDTITFAVAPPVEFAGLPFKAWYRY